MYLVFIPNIYALLWFYLPPILVYERQKRTFSTYIKCAKHAARSALTVFFKYMCIQLAKGVKTVATLARLQSASHIPMNAPGNRYTRITSAKCTIIT